MYIKKALEAKQRAEKLEKQKEFTRYIASQDWRRFSVRDVRKIYYTYRIAGKFEINTQIPVRLASKDQLVDWLKTNY